MAEVIAIDLAHRYQVALTVSSAGTDALVDQPATGGAVDTARRLGLDLSAHRSRPVDAELAAGADLLVTMERRHTLDLVNRHDAPAGRVFTLPELSAWATGRPPGPDETIEAWLHRLGADRTPLEALGAGEIDDPVGRSNRRYRRTAAEITAALDAVIAAMAVAGGR